METRLSRYDEKTVRIRSHGETFEGAAFWYPAEFCETEIGRAEDCLRIDDYYLFAGDIDSLELLREEMFIPLREYIEIRERAFLWCRHTSGLPSDFLDASLRAAVADQTPLPQWYLALRNDRFVAACGVTEDMTTYVFRAKDDPSSPAVAGDLLRFSRADLAARGIALPEDAGGA